MMCPGDFSEDDAYRMWIRTLRVPVLFWLRRRVHGLQLRTLVSNSAQVFWSRLCRNENEGKDTLKAKHYSW